MESVTYSGESDVAGERGTGKDVQVSYPTLAFSSFLEYLSQHTL